MKFNACGNYRCAETTIDLASIITGRACNVCGCEYAKSCKKSYSELERENAELKKLVATLAGAINNCNQANSSAICRHTIGVTAALEAAKGA